MNRVVCKEKNRHYIREGAEVVAEMTYSDVGDRAMIIDHTFVEPAYRGQSLGKVLLDSVVHEARENNKKVMPLCPYAKAQFDKCPQYNDVRV